MLTMRDVTFSYSVKEWVSESESERLVRWKMFSWSWASDQVGESATQNPLTSSHKLATKAWEQKLLQKPSKRLHTGQIIFVCSLKNLQQPDKRVITISARCNLQQYLTIIVIATSTSLTLFIIFSAAERALYPYTVKRRDILAPTFPTTKKFPEVGEFCIIDSLKINLSLVIWCDGFWSRRTSRRFQDEDCVAGHLPC